MIDAKEFFSDLHDIECNQKYNKNLQYSFHLEMVAKQAELFKHHLPNDGKRRNAVWAGIWGHDSIEDARLTYNDIKEKFGTDAAEIIYLCTEFKGRTRAERKPIEFYEDLKSNGMAVFVKLCDLIANLKFSLLTNSSMFNKYKEEWESKIKSTLSNGYYENRFADMFSYIDSILDIKSK